MFYVQYVVVFTEIHVCVSEKVQLTQADVEQKERDEQIRASAITKGDEDCPEVRQMDSIILRAKCAAIRDEQLKVKARFQKKEEVEEEKWHNEMMAEREIAEKKERAKQIKRHETKWHNLHNILSSQFTVIVQFSPPVVWGVQLFPFGGSATKGVVSNFPLSNHGGD